MRVLIWGMGYVGAVTAACLAEMGHTVIGLETDATIIQTIAEGRSVSREPGLDTLLQMAVAAGRLTVTAPDAALIAQSDLSLVCVGTPCNEQGCSDFGAIEQVAETIATGLGECPAHHFHTVVIRSTTPPGTLRHRILPLLEESGRVAGQDFGLAVNPEFLREGTAIADFSQPPYILVGAYNPRSGRMLAKLWHGIDAPIYHITPEEAETVKLVNNAFHSLKVGFANEVGRLCERLGVNAHQVMDVVCADTKLNISRAYLRPGFAFGGSCLPKDLRSLNHVGRSVGVDMPILGAVLPSNDAQIETARRKVHSLRVQNIGVLGISYKPKTGDLRESPVIALLRLLQEDGFCLRAYDPDVVPNNLFRGSREYLRRILPDFESVLCDDIAPVLQHADGVLLCQARPEFEGPLQVWCDSHSERNVVNLTGRASLPLGRESRLMQSKLPIGTWKGREKL